MGVSEERAALMQLSDKELIDRILAFPDRQYLNVDTRGRRQYPVGEMAVTADIRMKKTSGYELSWKQRYAMANSFAVYTDGIWKTTCNGERPVSVPGRSGQPSPEDLKGMAGAREVVWFRLHPDNPEDKNDVNNGRVIGVIPDGHVMLGLVGLRKQGKLYITVEDGNRTLKVHPDNIFWTEDDLRQAIDRQAGREKTIPELVSDLVATDDRTFLKMILSDPDKNGLDHDRFGNLKEHPTFQVASSLWGKLLTDKDYNIPRRQKAAMATDYARHLQGAAEEMVDKDIYVYAMDFDMNGSPRASMEKHINETYDWAGLLNRQLEGYFPERVSEGAFRLSGHTGSFVLKSEQPLPDEALTSSRLYLEHVMHTTLADDLMRNGLVYMKDDKQVFITRQSYFTQKAGPVDELTENPFMQETEGPETAAYAEGSRIRKTDRREPPLTKERADALCEARKPIYVMGEERAQRMFLTGRKGSTLYAVQLAKDQPFRGPADKEHIRDAVEIPIETAYRTASACCLAYKDMLEQEDEFTKAVESLSVSQSPENGQ